MILVDYLWSSHEGLTVIISDTQFGFFQVSIMKHFPDAGIGLTIQTETAFLNTLKVLCGHSQAL